MTESTEARETRGTIRYTGLPQEALREPAPGDPMALTVVRGHAGRCATCCETALCGDGESLVRVFESGRVYWSGLK